MGPLQIAERIKEQFPDDVLGYTEFRDQVTVSVKRDNIVGICRYLHDDAEMGFDYPASLCGVDYMPREPRFEVVYNLYSIKHRHRIVLKADVPESDPNIDTVTGIWTGVNWHERETFDMYGINFNGHPDMRRILMPEDWEGHPLRKDYPVTGPAREWKGYEEVRDRKRKFAEFEWKPLK
ncbi:MAG: NADH-quinone oxidoreductase subunit C [Nitrospirae bacterium]|nr:NADH-quinone oxidoreductase subunit C [Nitrospirota bacterium]